MSVPTSGEAFAKLIEHLRLAQEQATMLMHLARAEGDGPGKVIASGWFHVSENLKKMQHVVTQIATGKMQ